MIITYQGNNYFKLQSGGFTVLIDPDNQRSFKSANLVVHTLNPAKVSQPENADFFWIDHPGEYEIGDVKVRGWHNDRGNQEKNVYVLKMEDIRVLVLGGLSKIFAPEVQEKIGEVDLIIMSSPAKEIISGPKLTKLIRQIEPAMVVLPDTKDVKPLLDDFNKSNCKTEDKIVVKKKDLNNSTMDFRCLKF